MAATRRTRWRMLLGAAAELCSAGRANAPVPTWIVLGTWVISWPPLFWRRLFAKLGTPLEPAHLHLPWHDSARSCPDAAPAGSSSTDKSRPQSGAIRLALA